MTTYAITAATGQLGRLAIDHLLAKGVAAADVVALARTPEKAADLVERGVQVREGDYERPGTLDAALAGVDKLLLVSGSEVGQRVPQHTNVVEAAKKAGVSRLLYTSMLRATTSALVLAPEHKAAEDLITASGLTYTLLRNPLYVDLITGQVASYLAQGVVLHAAREGRIALATRSELAEAAAAALLEDVDGNVIYKLGGPSFTMADLAGAITEATRQQVQARAVSPEELAAALTAAGLDEGVVGLLVAVDRNIAGGEVDNDTDHLARLLGRPAGSLADAVRAAPWCNRHPCRRCLPWPRMASGYLFIVSRCPRSFSSPASEATASSSRRGMSMSCRHGTRTLERVRPLASPSLNSRSRSSTLSASTCSWVLNDSSSSTRRALAIVRCEQPAIDSIARY